MRLRLAAIFLIFFFVALGVKSFSPGLYTDDDPYYHARHAWTFHSGERMSALTTSPMGEASLYLVYHRLMAPFTVGFDTSDYESVIWGVRVYHALITGLFFALFYYVAQKMLGTHKYAMFALLLMAASSLSFSIRMLIDRPLAVTSIFFLLTFYFLIRKNYIALAIVSVLFPLTYSVSFIILILPIVFATASVIYHRRIIALYFVPLAIVIGGIGVGVLLHPDTGYYLYNAYYLGFMTAMNSVQGVTIEGGEMGTYFSSIAKDPFTFVLSIWLVCGWLYATLLNKPSYGSRFSFQEYFMLVAALTLLPLFLVISRAVDYYVPILILAIVMLLVRHVMPKLKRFADLKLPEFSKSWKATVVELIHSIIKDMLNSQKILVQNFVLALLVLTVIVTYIKIGMHASSQSPYNIFAGAAEYMKEHSAQDEVVFINRFDFYPQLVFFNNHNRYTIGGGMTGTFAQDPALYWYWYNSVYGKTICPKKECDESEGEELYAVIKEKFNTKFVFVNSKDDGHNSNITKFVERLDQDSRFKKVFTDQKYPEILVYEL